jgi:protein SCO1/2
MRSLFFNRLRLMPPWCDSLSLVALGCQRHTAAIAGVVIMALAAGPLVRKACAESASNVTTYFVKGVFEESRSAGRQAVIAHEIIPGYMEAMTMPFNVKIPAELNGLRPGDKITFRLSVTDTDDWIDEIKKAGGRGATPKSAQPVADAVQELEPGALLPECILTNQSGLIVHMRDFKGQALAFTFFFSRCPLPTFCPRMNNNFAAVLQTLESDATRTNWQLLSLSFDPGFDTPEHLRDFATLQQIDPKHWNFATSSSEEIRKLGGAFGLKFWHENGSFSHNLRTVVVGSSGRVQKVFTGNEWQPGDLVAEMRRAMAAP